MTETRAGTAQIAQVEQATGIARATLRMWERRYGFPQPGRNESDERIYAPEQIDKLRLVRLMMDRGLRPGRLLAMPIKELLGLQQSHQQQPLAGADDPLLQLLRRHEPGGLLKLLSQWSVMLGLERFLVEKIIPLDTLIGQALECGDLQDFEVQVYAESLKLVLSAAMVHLQPGLADAAPRVMLSPMTDELHGPGLLMAQALLTLERCACVPLGAKLSAARIAAAAAAFDADLLVLSCAPATPAKEATNTLVQLRHTLPGPVQIWHVGSRKAVQKASIPGVMALHDLLDMRAAIARYRATRHHASGHVGGTGITPLTDMDEA